MFRTSMIKSLSVVTALSVTAAIGVTSASGQALVAQYDFDGDLTEASGHVDLLSNPAPDGVFMEGTTLLASVTGTAAYTNGYDGTPNSAILLDGVDDWIDVGVNGLPNFAQSASPGRGIVAGTVVAWIKTGNFSEQFILGSLNHTDSMAFQAGTESGQLKSFYRSSDGSYLFVNEEDGLGAVAADNQWHLVAYSWDADLEGPAAWEPPMASFNYLDNVKATTYETNWFNLDITDIQTGWDTVMAIGAKSDRNIDTSERLLSGHFEGAIDKLRVYDYQLSDAELTAIWNAESAGLVDLSGDINGDGFVGIEDLNIVLSTWNNGTPPSTGAPTIPEPASLAMLAIGSLAMLRRRTA